MGVGTRRGGEEAPRGRGPAPGGHVRKRGGRRAGPTPRDCDAGQAGSGNEGCSFAGSRLPEVMARRPEGSELIRVSLRFRVCSKRTQGEAKMQNSRVF